MRAHCFGEVVTNFVMPPALFNVGPISLAFVFLLGGIAPFFIKHYLAIPSRPMLLVLARDGVQVGGDVRQ